MMIVRRTISKLTVQSAMIIALSTLCIVPVSTISAAEEAKPRCSANVTPAPTEPMHLNLVIDDSGSMFYDGPETLDRWSFAKYSLEVFAALLRKQDSLSVYRLSDYVESGNERPALQISGTAPISANIDQIRAMQFAGKGTPYAAVEQGYADLLAQDTRDQWLIVVTDGKFKDSADNFVSTEKVQDDLESFLEQAKKSDKKLKVAFLALGDEAPEIESDPATGLYFAKANTSEDFLEELTGFSNVIFGRAKEEPDSNGVWNPDVDLESVMVLAQGDNVEIGEVTTVDGSRSPDSVVDVSWTDNQDLKRDGGVFRPIPNQTLEGKIATFTDIPKGQVQFNISNASSVQLYFKPRVNFGINLIDESGRKVNADETVGGKYQIEYGFMDADCNLIESDLLGEIEYSSVLTQDGQQREFANGEILDLERGEVTLDASATFLQGATASASIPLKVLQQALPSEIQAGTATFYVSEMAEFPIVENGIPLRYVIKEGGRDRPPTQEEWAGLTSADVEFLGDSNLEFEIVKEVTPGKLRLLVRAPGGDVYAADTGNLQVTVRSSRVYDQQESAAEGLVQLEVIDDLSFMDRLINWFKTIGWKLLLALLLLILLLGYLFKKRFSKRMKAKPTIIGTPKRIGIPEVQEHGKFQRNTLRRFLPFVADTGTLKYVPSAAIGFRTMKLKAVRGKAMTVTNWREIAQKDNTEINGNPLGPDSTRAPIFGASSNITASTPDMTYDMTPSS